MKIEIQKLTDKDLESKGVAPGRFSWFTFYFPDFLPSPNTVSFTAFWGP
ncbi:MAG: hypothetical protein V3S16_13015 [Candidatus Desulfatibia sp.]